MIIQSILQYTRFYILDNIINIYIKTESTRYFLLHFLFNMYLIYLTWNTFIDCLLNPMNIFDEDYNYYSILSTINIMNFHIYHMLTHKKELSTDTIIHHIIGAVISPIITINQPLGKLPVMHNIILCGIPGGIDYLLLVLVKFNKIHRMTEKYINKYLNLLIRWPFIFLSNYIFFLNIYYEKTNLILIPLISLFINNFNAIYFCDSIIGNYYMFSIYD